jgi:hypothetical protein
MLVCVLVYFFLGAQVIDALNAFLRNAKPALAISSRDFSISLQIAAALAIALTSVVNDSITTSF